MPIVMTDTTTAHETAQLERANTSGLMPVVFVHGLWLLPSSWDRWATLFEQAGYLALTPEWPDDARMAAGASAHPEVFACKSNRPGPLPGRAPPAGLGAEVGQAGARSPGQPAPRGSALLRPVPLRVRERGQRG